MRPILGAAAAVASLWLLGRGLRAVLPLRRDDEHPIESLGLDFLFGAGAGSLIFFAVALRSNAWAFRSVYVLTLALAVAAAVRGRLAPSLRADRSWFWGALAMLAAVHVVRGIVGSFTSDGYAHWGLKSKAIFAAGRIPADILVDAERFGYALPDYPLLWPVIEVWTYLHMGALNDQVVRLLGSAFLLALGAVFYGRLRAACGATASLAATFLLLAPHQWARSGASGLAEPPLSAFLFAGFAALAAFAEKPSPRAAAQAALLLGFAAWTKNEGAAAAAVGGAIFAWLALDTGLGPEGPPASGGRVPPCGTAPCQGRARAPKRIALFALLAALPSIPWLLFRQAHGISGYFAAGVAPISEAGIRLKLIAVAFVRNCGEIKGWMFVWPVLLLGVAFGFRAIRTMPAGRVLLAGALGTLLAYLVALLLSPLDAGWQIPTALPRLLMQVEAPLLACLALAAARRDDAPQVDTKHR
ncbi:MAG: hypothetical protein HYY17_02920 [Planctomycetes bacterium]|nr:hypothetical protein [Planctomycetota bacterium]